MTSSRSCWSVIEDAVDVLRAEEIGEQVFAHAAGTALADDAVDDLVELAHSAQEAEAARRGQLEEETPHAEPGVLADEGVHGSGDDRHLRAEVDAEQRAGGNGQRGLHHLAMDVELLAVAPGVERECGLARHDVGVGGDAGAMKRGLAETALPQPEVAFAGEQAVAEEFGVGARSHAFGKAAVVRHKH